MISCNDAQHDFSAYWEGELSTSRREGLASHWSTCEPCRGAYESFAAAMQAVRALPRLAAPDDLTARVLARVHAVEAARSAARWSPARLFDWVTERPDWGWRPALAAVTAVFAVVAAVALLQRGAELPSPQSAGGPAVALDLPDDHPAAEPEAASPAAPAAPAPAPLAVAIQPEGSAETSPSPAPRERKALPTESLAGAAEAPAGGTASTFLDSLLLHGGEVEYALDRIRLRNVPGDSGLTPMPAMPGTPEGKPASLTF